MKISCPTCAAKYSVADEKIQSRLAKIRCRKCSSTIVIDGTASPAKVYIGDANAAISPSGPPQDMGLGDALSGSAPGSSPPAPGGADPVGPAHDEYAVDIADNDQRNMTIHQIIGAYNEGLITADTYIWKEGMADWQTLAEVREVASALHAAARPAAATPAAVRRGDHNSSADLFGRIDTAGGEDDITTSAPEPAASMTAGTGARNESSVLFSLSALTGSAGAPVPAPSAPTKRGRSDDSGLIDLQALTSGEASPGMGGFGAAPNAFGAAPLISAPLGGVSGPALGGGLAPGYGRRSGNKGLIIAALALAAVIIGGVAVFKLSGGDADQPTSALDKVGASPEPRPAPVQKEPEPVAAEPAKPEGTAAGTNRPVSAEELPETATPEPSAAPKPVAPKPVAARPKPAPKPVAPA
ncbi:MAG TPA: zinc-ribbon domain-containing protein, partial [Polyangiaceae bacterium]|nr:zinc-ribbon domain-containing protein [Polyangiaceae bacterium]